MNDNKVTAVLIVGVFLMIIVAIICQTISDVSKNKACQCSTIQTGGQK